MGKKTLCTKWLMTKKTLHYTSSPDQRTWKCRSLQNSRIQDDWLTNTFDCQTRPQADQQVCFQVEGRVGIWLSQCFNRAAVAAGCLRTTCSTNIKGRSAITLLLILFMFHAALKYISPPKPLKLFFSSSTLYNCNSLSELALTAGIVEHHDVIYGNVASPLPGNGCLNQHLQQGSEREYMMNRFHS